MASADRTTFQPARTLRADAAQNRIQLLETARDAFVESGDISMTALAKRAGVGVGTLYRHFPTKEALIIAVYQHEIRALADAAPELLRGHPALEATKLWFERLAYYGRMKHGVAAIIHGATSEGTEREAWNLVVNAIGTLLNAGAADGIFKPDLIASDVLWIVTFLWRIPSGPDNDESAQRMLSIVLDGLKTHT